MAHNCRTNADNGLPQISEARILDVAKTVSEDIGYRIVGTEEHAQGDVWMVDQARAFKDECDALAQSQGRALECEVWHQTGDGSHRCVDLGAEVSKSLIVRVYRSDSISWGTACTRRTAGCRISLSGCRTARLRARNMLSW